MRCPIGRRIRQPPLCRTRLLQRSIAAALLCRLRGSWPTWCTGVRTSPFAAHAWIEADGRAIGEPYPDGHYAPMLSVPPVARVMSTNA
ncbi:lasso peptide biosynthesis B2 protein [Amycolatopsis circi]|uniref:lasso peptide biosynthesis B2 protein n=1 Tax=Amycolatopsis circi TaxID=871959 RepID=UPI0031343D05